MSSCRCDGCKSSCIRCCMGVVLSELQVVSYAADAALGTLWDELEQTQRY